MVYLPALRLRHYLGPLDRTLAVLCWPYRAVLFLVCCARAALLRAWQRANHPLYSALTLLFSWSVLQWAVAAADHAWLVGWLMCRTLNHQQPGPPGRRERYCLSRALRLDPPTFEVTAEEIDTVSVTSGDDDGAGLLRATLWLPAARVDGSSGAPAASHPTIIIRSPYGATHSGHDEWGQIILAERGYAVLFQDTRGRFGSTGDFVPVEHERGDGAATVRWARKQPWCDGRVAVYGPSYLGMTAWACVGSLKPAELQAAVPAITTSVVLPAVMLPGGAISLELLVLWFYLIEMCTYVGRPLALLGNLAWTYATGRLQAALMHAPLSTLDLSLVGRSWPWYRRAVAELHKPDGPFWASRSVLCEMRPGHPDAAVPPPTTIVTGQHDFFFPQALIDYRHACALQPHCRLIVTPYDHWGVARLGGLQLMYREALCTFDTHLPPAHLPPAQAPCRPHRPLSWFTHGRSPREIDLPVQLCLLGSLRWRGFPCWPPPQQSTLRYWPTEDGTITSTPPMGSRPDSGLDSRPGSKPDTRLDAAAAYGPGSGRYAEPAEPPRTLSYTYLPNAPTPSAGGPSFNPFNSGSRNQRSIERRRDVLTFTSPPLPSAITIAGTPTLTLRLWASSRSVDLLGRLCLVTTARGSTNLCEGLTRVDAAADEPSVGAAASSASCSQPALQPALGPGVLVTVALGPVAAELPRGSRLRLHVASASHPRWMRNLCADPEVPIAEQTPPRAARFGEAAPAPKAAQAAGGNRSQAGSCRVHVAVDDAAGCLALPLVATESEPARPRDET